MKTLPLIALGVLLAVAPGRALDIPGADGSDGALDLTVDTVIDLSQAVTGVWDANNAAHAGQGIYDPEKWAVVFKYSSVNLAANTTITFTNHPSRAPVVWLVDGDVTIGGTLSLNGHNPDNDPLFYRPTEPGPGGFRGGDDYVSDIERGSGGFGPGGAFYFDGRGSQYPSHATIGEGVPSAPTYGNDQIIPLIGGSGGSGYLIPRGSNFGGGAGGGAILIAARGRITVDGMVSANGGPSSQLPGSGGAIRLVNDTIAGNGKLLATGGNTSAGLGRIRVETLNNLSRFAAMNPLVMPVLPDTPVVLWPAANAPRARIVSVSGLPAPADPRAEVGVPNLASDLRLANGDTVILVETDNLPQTAEVHVRLTPRSGGAVELTAVYVAGTGVPEQRRWRAQTSLTQGYYALQVRAVAP